MKDALTHGIAVCEKAFCYCTLFEGKRHAARNSPWL
jgi:hypothetical protein